MSSFRKKCRDLRRKDYTLPEIMEITGRPKTSVYYHIKDIPLSEEKQAEVDAENKKRLRNYTPISKGESLLGRSPVKFDEWGKDLVLLFGHLLFDGEIKRGGCKYSSSHEVLINRVIKLMQKIYPYNPKRSVDNETGVIKIGFYNVELGAYILEKSEELIKKVESMPNECKLAFLTAFFDDEGCAQYSPKNNKRRVRGYQNDMEMLELIQELLASFGIEGTLRENTCNEIVISCRNNLEKFQDKINFSPGVRINHKRANSTWDKPLEKRRILARAIDSYE